MEAIQYIPTPAGREKQNITDIRGMIYIMVFMELAEASAEVSPVFFMDCMDTIKEVRPERMGISIRTLKPR